MRKMPYLGDETFAETGDAHPYASRVDRSRADKAGAGFASVIRSTSVK